MSAAVSRAYAGLDARHFVVHSDGCTPEREPMASIDSDAQSAGVRRVLWITLGLNLAVSAGKVIVGYLSGSLAMVADGYHSLVDGSNNVIGLIVAAFAFSAARPQPPLRPPQVRDRRHRRDRRGAAGARLAGGGWRSGPDGKAGDAGDRSAQLGGHGRDDRHEPRRQLVRGPRGPTPEQRLSRGRRHPHPRRPLRVARRRRLVRGRTARARLGRPPHGAGDRLDHRLAGGSRSCSRPSTSSPTARRSPSTASRRSRPACQGSCASTTCAPAAGATSSTST